MELPEELVEEVLLRFPPEDPASLVRAALVCKRWCRLICGRGFSRRFREFHRSPPMLGFLSNLIDGYCGYAAQFIPASSFHPPRAKHSGCLPIDVPHGRVLLRKFEFGEVGDIIFAIWDLATDEQWELPVAPERGYVFACNAAVLCAATGSGACDHLDCHGGPFIVVSLSSNTDQVSYLSVYSSQAGDWSEPTPVGSHSIDANPAALVGNALCFLSEYGRAALMYDLATQETSFIELPLYLHPVPQNQNCTTALVTMKDGGLGVARLDRAARLSLWSIEANLNGDMGMEWTQIRVIELEKLLPVSARDICPFIFGFAHYAGVFFVGTSNGLFTVDLNSNRVRKVSEEVCNPYNICRVVPYVSFHTPVFGAASASTGEAPRTGASSASKA